MEEHFIKRNASSCSDLPVESLTMHFQVLQNFFHSLITTDIAEVVHVKMPHDALR